MIALRRVASEGEGCLAWLMRHGPAQSTHDGSQRLFRNGRLPDAKLREGFWLKLVRRYPTVELYVSTDGDAWQGVAPDYHLALLEQEVKVGLMVSAGGTATRRPSYGSTTCRSRLTIRCLTGRVGQNSGIPP